jgi:death-on-curing protein
MFHPFADGNKRTALVASDICLRLNGYRLVPSEAVEPFFWAIARGEKDVEEIAIWLQSHVEPWVP